MRAEYEPRHFAWKQEAAEWDDAAWARCSTPKEKADFSTDRFFDHYFLTDGKPDPSKTKEPLVVPGFRRYTGTDITYKAYRVSGLACWSEGDEDNRTFYTMIRLGTKRPRRLSPKISSGGGRSTAIGIL